MCDCDCELPKQERWAKIRAEGAEIVRSFSPKNPDSEADEAISWALDLAAQAVERGRR